MGDTGSTRPWFMPVAILGALMVMVMGYFAHPLWRAATLHAPPVTERDPMVRRAMFLGGLPVLDANGAEHLLPREQVARLQHGNCLRSSRDDHLRYHDSLGRTRGLPIEYPRSTVTFDCHVAVTGPPDGGGARPRYQAVLRLTYPHDRNRPDVRMLAGDALARRLADLDGRRG